MSGKILLVEDDTHLRESICDALTLKGHEIVAVGTGVAFRQQLKDQQFSVALIDIGLPDVSGFELAEEVRKFTSTKIIILTALGSMDDRIRGYRSGGHLYFSKPVNIRELSAAVYSLNRQNLNVQDNADHEKNIWKLIFTDRSITTPDNKKIQLTANELKFLHLLASAKGQTVDREELLTQLYPRLDTYTSRALDALVRRLRKKLKHVEPHNLPIQNAYGKGFLFSCPLNIHK